MAKITADKYFHVPDQAFFPGQRVRNVGTWRGKKGTGFGRTGTIHQIFKEGYSIIWDGDDSPTEIYGHEELKQVGKKKAR